MKKSIFLLAALLGLPVLQGCDVNVGVYDYGYDDYGYVGWYGPGYYHRPRYGHGHGWGRRGHHGGGHHGGGHHRGGGRGRGHHNDLIVETAATLPAAQANDAAALLAADYGIGVSSARRILALGKGEGRQEALEVLKLTSDELAVFARLDIPAPSTVRKIAAALGEDSAKISRLIRDFISDMRALKEAKQTEDECLNQFNCQN